MKLKISKRQFLAQLPDKIRTDLIGANDLPDFFLFDAEMVQDETDVMETTRNDEKFLEVAKHVTGMQFYMFSVLANKYPNPASITLLSRKVKGNSGNIGNTVAVHIMGLKKNLKKHNLPFDIESKRASVSMPGLYLLIKK